MSKISEFKAVKAFFIFEKASGNTLFIRSYEKTTSKTPDAHLVVAFLTAMFSFAKSSSLSDLKVVDMTDLRFSFIEKNELIFAVLVSPLISPLDIQFKLTTIASLFFSDYQQELNNLDKLIETDVFSGFSESVDEIFSGETREMLKSSKNAAKFYLKKLVDRTGSGARGAMILSFTGDILLEYKMDQVRMAAAIRILNVGTYMMNLRYLIVASEGTHLIAYKISEGLLLAVDGHPSYGVETLVVDVSETVRQIKEIIPH
jgi:hypothetical protein